MYSAGSLNNTGQMATVHKLLPGSIDFFAELQRRTDRAEALRHKRFHAALLIQRTVRGFLIRKHVAWLSYNATIIQCAFRVHRARKAYRVALKRAVRLKHFKHYARAAIRIQVRNIFIISVLVLVCWQIYAGRQSYQLYCKKVKIIYILWLPLPLQLC